MTDWRIQKVVSYQDGDTLAGRLDAKSELRGKFCFLLLVLLSLYIAGCGEQVQIPSAEQVAEFENAGPARPTVDLDHLVRAGIDNGPYRVVPGDVLQLTMPAILQMVTGWMPEATEKVAPYLHRVSENDTIGLPIVGQLEIAGKTLAQIETAVSS